MYTQHRFYGESMPFGNDSYKSVDTLGYLTSTQALADLAILITSLKSNLSVPDAPVVVFGGSYGGSKHYAHPLIYPNAYPSCDMGLDLSICFLHAGSEFLSWFR
jgi:lysosomal Pro-X carboxypeptidase